MSRASTDRPTPEERKLVAADDLTRVAGLAADVLRAAPDDAWARPAGSLEWSCRTTVEHIATAHYLYGSQLARRDPGKRTLIVRMTGADASRPHLVLRVNPEGGPDELLDLLEANAALLAASVRVSAPSARAWHPLGVTDPEGFAAMGVVEVVAHTHDIAEGLGLDWAPPADVCARALGRLFPDVAVRDADGPWPTLLWATGRAALPDRPRRSEWNWHNAPREDA